jgi:hypothetical protein
LFEVRYGSFSSEISSVIYCLKDPDAHTLKWFTKTFPPYFYGNLTKTYPSLNLHLILLAELVETVVRFLDLFSQPALSPCIATTALP